MSVQVFTYKRAKRFFTTLFITYLSVVIYATLFTYNYYIYGKSVNLIAFSSIKLMFSSGNILLILKNVVGNVILFFPFGFFLPLMVKRFRRFYLVFTMGFVFSGGIEACQYYFAERIFDVDDILLNTIGTVLGYVIYKMLYFPYRMIKRNI